MPSGPLPSRRGCCPQRPVTGREKQAQGCVALRHAAAGGQPLRRFAPAPLTQGSLRARQCPCLSLWERWPSAARTERANRTAPGQKAAKPSRSPAATALPEGEPWPSRRPAAFRTRLRFPERGAFLLCKSPELTVRMDGPAGGNPTAMCRLTGKAAAQGAL